MKLRRRDGLVLAGSAGMARAADRRTLRFVPIAMPASLDPIATPSLALRPAAMAIFETLYATDAQYNPVSAMAGGQRIEDGGRTWTIRLRPDLRFHDGTPVTAQDCAASLGRWMKRGPVGQALVKRLTGLDALDAGTLRFRLSAPLPMLPALLTRSEVCPPVIMPARLAAEPPDRPVREAVGSGPFRLKEPRWAPGGDLRLVPFEAYVPREEVSNFLSGRHRPRIDEIVWSTPADPVQALRDGTADWVEWLPPDATAETLNDPNVIAGRLDEMGHYAVLRLNGLDGPTANPRFRQTLLASIDRTAVMEAVFGANGGRFADAPGLFIDRSPYVTDQGMDRIGARRSRRALQAELREAGYRGEPLIVLRPEADPIHAKMTDAVATELRGLDIAVDVRPVAPGVRERPRFAQPAAAEAWSAFCESEPGADHYDAFAIPGPGWAGWPVDPRTEALWNRWIDAQEPRARQVLAGQLQEQVFTTAAIMPLGQWYPLSAWRTTMSGPAKGSFPVFWDLELS